VAVANGVVYFQSMLDGTLYALNAKTGALLAQVQTGGETSGPAISRGQIYLGTGEAGFVAINPAAPLGPGSVVALGLANSSGQERNLQVVPFLAQASATISSTHSTAEGVLTTFTTQGQGLFIGSYTSTGFYIVKDGMLSGRETFVTGPGDQFVMTFTGTLRPDGSILGTFTLEAGTGRFQGISGLGVLITTLDTDGVHFEQIALGVMLRAEHD
jgi:outer membrane protein assembly factor BamB